MGVDEETASLLRTEAAPEPRRGRSASVAACVAAVGVVREPPARDPLRILPPPLARDARRGEAVGTAETRRPPPSPRPPPSRSNPPPSIHP